MQEAQAFVDVLKGAKFNGSGLDKDTIKQLRNPRRKLPDLAKNPVLKLVLRHFIDNGHSEKAFRKNRASAMEFDLTLKLPTLKKTKRIVQELSRVVPIKTDMCPHSCITYTGLYAHLDRCPKCKEHEERYEIIAGKHVPRHTFGTHPLGLQAQALYTSADSVERMHHCAEALKKLQEAMDADEAPDVADDCFFGSDYLDAAGKTIKPEDLTLMFLVDGAQLYKMKQSDCWIYVWVLLDMSPKDRYKKGYVLPGVVLPGPNKLQDLNSFLLPGLYHIAALQNEGLKIWDASWQHTFVTHPIIVFATADTVAMAVINSMVGHSGVHRCQWFCGMRRRHRPREGHYYPAMPGTDV